MFNKIYGFVKKHALVGIAVTTALGGVGIWISRVNATGDDVIQMKAIVPRIETQLTNISQKQDHMNDGITDIKERVSNIEGRLKR